MRGRVRLRIHEARGQPERLGRVLDKLASHHDVREVRADHRTGSVVVLGDLAIDALRNFGREQELFELVPAPELQPLSEDIVGGLETADERIRLATGGRLGVMSLAATALVGIAAVQAVRGQISVPAMTLLWYAFSVVLMARSGRKLLLT